MAFRKDYFKGATSEDLKKAIAYHNFLISNADVEALKQKKIDEMFEMYSLNQATSSTEEITATIKSNLIITDNGNCPLFISRE